MPRVSIPGPAEMFVDVGSEASVECRMENLVTRPEFVLWSFNNKVRGYCLLSMSTISIDIHYQVCVL